MGLRNHLQFEVRLWVKPTDHRGTASVICGIKCGWRQIKARSKTAYQTKNPLHIVFHRTLLMLTRT